MQRAAFPVLLTAGIATPAASAQTLEEFTSCTGVDNDIERLACFDRVATPLMKDEAAKAGCICRLLMSAQGVGFVAALTFKAAVDDPKCFRVVAVS